MIAATAMAIVAFTGLVGSMARERMEWTRVRDAWTRDIATKMADAPKANSYSTDEDGCDTDAATCYEVAFVGDRAHETGTLFVPRNPF